MKIKVRTYRKSDFKNLVRLMEEFQDLFVGMDPLKRTRRKPDYGNIYTKKLIRKIKGNDGLFLLAEYKVAIIGLVAGMIEKQPKFDLLESVPTKSGRVLELFVRVLYRKKGIGKLLMGEMKNHFKKKGCDAIKVSVFAPNKEAHQFYRHLGYEDRVTDLIKILK